MGQTRIQLCIDYFTLKEHNDFSHHQIKGCYEIKDGLVHLHYPDSEPIPYLFSVVHVHCDSIQKADSRPQSLQSVLVLYKGEVLPYIHFKVLGHRGDVLLDIISNLEGEALIPQNQESRIIYLESIGLPKLQFLVSRDCRGTIILSIPDLERVGSGVGCFQVGDKYELVMPVEFFQ